MSDSRDAPHAKRWDDTKELDRHWWRFLCDAYDKEPVPVHASVTPALARAGQPGVWRVSLAFPEHTLRRGAHVTLELSSHWQLHLGRPVRIHPTVLHVARPEDIKPGYGCHVLMETPEGVECDYAVNYASYSHIIDVAIVSGEVAPGAEIEIQLGSDDGSELRAQMHAQKAIFHTFVDLNGDDDYRPVSDHPSVDVIGNQAEMLRLVIPSAAQPGEAIEAYVSAVDLKSLNPASGYSATVDVRDEACRATLAGPVHFDDAQFAATRVSVRMPDADGVVYLTALDRDNAMLCRGNPCRLGGERAYFGDLHGQNYIGQGVGTMDDYYAWARDAEALDFCAWAGYEYRTPLDGDKWRERVVEVGNRYNDEGGFVVMQGLEWSGDGGHRNIYVPGDDIPFHGSPLRRAPRDTVIPRGEWVPSGVRPTELWRALEDIEAITIPHHPKFMGGANWEYRNDAMQPVVEICSQWGISEEGGPHSVQAALLLGHRFGFVGGTDTHVGQPGHGPHNLNEGIGLAAVYAAELTRRAIFDAIVARRCYATTGPRILLDYELEADGEVLRMGQEGRVPNGPRTLRISVAGCDRLARVEVLRNCEVVHSVEPRERCADLEWSDADDLSAHLIASTPFGDAHFALYYVRVTQADDHKAWGSPIWVSR
ncbi:MAG: DUF3604 domain-containing protein [Armatimonadota bacterium]|jgi:hypothetical protein